eukprot:m51a1_g727 putative n6-adenosine-methyltransferase mt-a70-like (780) ;mRNA; r:466016-468870
MAEAVQSLLFLFNVTLGQTCDLSAHIPYAGIALRDGLIAAAHELGSFNGPVTLDDQFDASLAANNTEELLGDEWDCLALACTTGTDASLAALRVAKEARAPLLGAASGAGSLRTPFSGVAVNLRPSYMDEIAAIVSYAVRARGWGRAVALVAQREDPGPELKRTLEKAMLELSPRGSAITSFYAEDTPELILAALQEVLQKDPQVVILYGYGGPLGRVIADARKVPKDDDDGLPPLFTLSSTDASQFRESLIAENTSLEGIYVSESVMSPVNGTSTLVVRYTRAMLRRFPQRAPDFLSLEGYIVGRLFHAVLKETSRLYDEVTRQRFLDTLYDREQLWTLDDLQIGPFSRPAPGCVPSTTVECGCSQGLHTVYIFGLVDGPFTEIPNSRWDFNTCGTVIDMKLEAVEKLGALVAFLCTAAISVCLSVTAYAVMESGDSGVMDEVERLLGRESFLEAANAKQRDAIVSVLAAPSYLESRHHARFVSPRQPCIVEYCSHGTREDCRRARAAPYACPRVHWRRVERAHTDPTLGDCSYLDGCRHMDTCKFMHYEVDAPTPVPPGGSTHDAQWISCDIRSLDLSVLGKFGVIMADPPWDIHMELPYGTLNDEEMKSLNVQSLMDDGLMFLWVTGRAMEVGRECLAIWGYRVVEELLWVKTNQLQRIIRTGRTGHWLNHSKEHCIIGIKGNPQLNRMLDCDVLVSEVRETSRKPDEVYSLIERMSPGTRKLELFGRMHNTHKGWITLGNQLQGTKLFDQEILRRASEKYGSLAAVPGIRATKES